MAQSLTFAGTQTTVTITGLSCSTGLAFDAKGDLFVADICNNKVIKIPAGGGTNTTVGTGLNEPADVAVDAGGNVYIADELNNRVVKIPAGGGAQTTVGTGLNQPEGLSVDAAGDVFIADFRNNRVVEVPAGGGTQTTVGTGLSQPIAVLADAAGNVFISNSNDVIKVPAGGTTQFVIASGFRPIGLVLDQFGNLFVGSDNTQVVQLQPYSVNFGTANVCASGQTTPTPCSQTLTLQFSGTASDYLSTTTALTNGIAGLDFSVSSSTCTGLVGSGSVCTVTVVFAPKSPGLRGGALEIIDDNGNIAGTVDIRGTALAPQIAFGPGVQSTLSAGNLSGPTGVAVDVAGNVYIADNTGNAVYKLPAGSGTRTTVGSGWSAPRMVAVDGAGNLYVADSGNNRVVKIPANLGTEVVLPATDLNMPLGLAVDGAGNVFIADTNNSRVVELPAAGGPQITVAASGLTRPFAVAVDAAGDLFIADYGNSRVVELPVNGGAQTTVGSGLTSPESLAVDAAGDVFVADTINERVVEISPASGTQTTVGSGWLNPTGVSVDQTGNVFVADVGITLVAEVQRSQAPTLTYANTNVGSISTDSPRSVTVTNIGTANLTLSGLTVGPNFVKVAGSGTPADCTSSTSLAGGTSCNLSISFEPAAHGVLQSTAVLTDNTLNGSSVTQNITLNGTSLQSQTITFAAITTQYAGTHFTLNATASSGLTVTFTSSTTSICSVSGKTATMITAGTCTIVASQAGNPTYAPATPVSQSFAVNLQGQYIIFNAIPNYPVGLSISLTASAGSRLPVVYTSLSTNVCTVSGSTAMLIAVGTCLIQASQSGNSVYAPAPTLTQSFGVLSNAQTLVFAGAQTTVGTGLNEPSGVALDAAGDLFIADLGNARVVEVPAGGGAQVNIATGALNGPEGLAVDAAGDIFIADSVNNRILEVPAGGGPLTTVGTGLSYPSGVALDAAGDVFIADYANNRVVKVPAGGGTQTTVGTTGLSRPFGVALDAAGDLFISDTNNDRVVEVAAAGGAQTTVSSGFLGPTGIALDAAGDLFVADINNSRVVEMPAGGGPQLTIASNLSQPIGVTVDGSGDVFIANQGSSAGGTYSVIEVQTTAVNFGSVNVCAAGQTSPAPCSQTLTLNYNVTANGTLGALNVLTGGAANFDFALGTGSTCTGSVTAGTQCTINVTFTPIYAGLRKGAVQITDGSGNVLATTYVSGTGVGPQIAFGPGVQSTLATGAVNGPEGVAVDGAGDVFLADSFNNRVLEMPAGGGTPVTLVSGLNTPGGLAVDGAGNVWIGDSFNRRVLKVPAAGGAPVTVASNLSAGIAGVAVDGAGNVYVADSGNNRVIEIPSVGGAFRTLSTTGLNQPTGVAVDGSGNVFLVDSMNKRVVKLASGSGAQTTVASSLSGVFGVAVDSVGDVFVTTDFATGSSVFEVPASGGSAITVATGLSAPRGIAVDAGGNLFIAQSGNNSVISLQRSLTPTLTFAPTLVGSTSSDSPHSVTLTNIGNAPLTATGLSIGTNFAQVAGSGTAADCTSSTVLAAGAACNLSISFTPTALGSLQSAAVFTDNALNGNPATQSITLTGTGSTNLSVSVSASVPGASFTVDGTSYTSAQTLTWLSATSHTLSTTSPQTGGTGTQYLFTAWSDGGPISHSVIASASTTSYIAGFQTQYLLTTATNPVAGGSAYGGGYYNTNSVVPVIAVPNVGYYFVNWTGAVANSASAGTNVTMSSAQTVTANFAAIQTQTIGFGAIPPQGAGTTLALTATASSGLAVSYAASPSSVCSVSGSTASFLAAGSCSITASQPGNVAYAPATPVTQIVNVFAPAAQYVGVDMLSQGTWTGEYGGDGFSIVNGTSSVPSYATLSLTGGAAYTWTASSTDVRALQTASGASTRIASAYYAAGSFSINLNLTDGNSHRVALYLLDWDSSARAETISVLNASTQAVLSTQKFSNFHSGTYAVWNLTGSVVIQVTNTGGPNALVAGVFFDPVPTMVASASYSATDAVTQGTWTGQYGGDGNVIATETAAAPAYASVTVAGAAAYAWAPTTTDPRALQTASGASARIASTYYAGSSFTLNITLTDGNAHRVALYLLDWDTSSRAETISVIDANTHLMLDTESYANFHNGVYAAWNMKGSVLIQVTGTGGVNPVVAGIFFDPVVTTTASATYSGMDVSTQGSWTGQYGNDGNVIATETALTPAYATVSFAGSSAYAWAPSSTDPRALQTVSGATTRLASTYYATSGFSINVNLTDGNAHRLALYLLDWDTNARAETISILDAHTHAVLDTESYSNFHNGVYATWDVKGDVVIQVTATGGANPVVAGIFFDPVPSTPAATAIYVGTDTTTEGTWTGTYGSTGEIIPNDVNAVPAFATVSVTGDSAYTWASATSDPRALQAASGATSGFASTFYAAGEFTIAVNLTDGMTHKISLYLLDWDSNARSETITIIDANSHVLLSTQSYSSFHNGEYAVWTVSGNVLIQVTNAGGANAVVSGVFFD